MEKNILFFYTDPKFKNYIQKKSIKVFKQSVFLKGNINNYIGKKDFGKIEVLSVFIDSKLSSKTLKYFPSLKKIITRSTGVDHIDEKYCNRNNIEILNIPEYGSQTIAEFALASLLFLLRNFEHNKIAEKNRGLDLKGKTVGVIGSGKIGKNFIKLVRSFGVKIFISDPYPDKIFAEKYNVKYVSFNKLLKNSDIISIHTPLCKSTFHLFSRKEFNQMKENTILINTARGGILDTKALYKALKSGKLMKAGLDVLENENDLLLKNKKKLTKKRREILLLNKKIIKNKNILYTHHQAYNTKEAVERIWEKTLKYLI